MATDDFKVYNKRDTDDTDFKSCFVIHVHAIFLSF